MDKKEALQQIIYKLKEIEGTRLRLSAAKADSLDLELALLNQQIINTYQQIQNFRSGLYATAPAEQVVIHEPKQKPEPVQTPKPEPVLLPKAEPVYIPKPEPEPEEYFQTKPLVAAEIATPEPEPDAELKRENKDAVARKERLKRLEAEAARAQSERKAESPVVEPYHSGGQIDFNKIVEEKYEEADIAEESAKISGKPAPENTHASSTSKPAVDLTLNEKLQSGKSLPGSLNDKFQQGDNKKTLAEKMKLGPITDLKSAMALNQKIAFTNGLFSGDDKEFKKALSFLSSCRNFSEAKIYLQTEIGKIHNWNENDPLVEEFTELVYRKFL